MISVTIPTLVNFESVLFNNLQIVDEIKSGLIILERESSSMSNLMSIGPRIIENDPVHYIV